MPGMFSIVASVCACPDLSILALSSWASDEKLMVMTAIKLSTAFRTDHSTSAFVEMELLDDPSAGLGELGSR
jgi:hypothetical protein